MGCHQRIKQRFPLIIIDMLKKFSSFTFVLLLFSSPFLFSQTANSFYESGVAKQSKKDFAGAILEFTKCIQKSEIFYQAFYERGNCNFELKKYAEAVKDFTGAIQINKNYYEAYLHRANAYFKQNQPKPALADLQKLMNQFPEKEQPYIVRAAYYNSQKEFKSAMSDLTKAIQLNASSADAYYQRGLVFVEQKKTEDALPDFTKSIQLGKSDAEVFQNRALIYEQQANWKNMVQDLVKVQSLKVLDNSLKEKLAIGYYYLKDYKNAEVLFAQLIVIFTSKKPDLLYFHGNCCKNLNDIEGAIKDFSKLSQMQPANDTIHVMLGEMFIAADKVPNAMLHFNKAISLNTSCSSAYAARAAVLMTQKKYTQAIEDYSSAIKVKPDGEFFFHRAECKDALQDKTAACDDLKMAFDLGYKKAGDKMKNYCK